MVNIEDLRPACSQAVAFEMDYLIDCKYNAANDELYVLAGADAGHLAVFEVRPGEGVVARATASDAQALSTKMHTHADTYSVDRSS